MKMEEGILFVADGSISNPIIYTQGLPLFNFLKKDNVNAVFVTFEEEDLWEKAVEFGKKIKKDFPFIVLHQIKIKRIPLVPTWFSFFYTRVSELLKIVNTYNIKTIHARSLFPGIIAMVLQFFGNIRIIYDNRGVYIEEEILKGHWDRASVRALFFKIVESSLIKRADNIVVVSNKFKSYILQKYSINERKITVIPNRTNLQSINESDLLRSNDLVNLIYSGSGAKWQEIGELKIVFTEARKIFDNAVINILSYDIELTKSVFANEPELEFSVNFMTAKSSEVFTCLIKNNVGLLIRENNIINNVAAPLKFAEYLSAGLPVLVSEGVGDTAEIIDKFKVGVVIKNKNYQAAFMEMNELLKDPNIYRRCREIAVKYFDINYSFLQYEKVYGIIKDA
jgi:glycosyltransferase involved in cell wall biosynthesis